MKAVLAGVWGRHRDDTFLARKREMNENKRYKKMIKDAPVLTDSSKPYSFKKLDEFNRISRLIRNKRQNRIIAEANIKLEKNLDKIKSNPGFYPQEKPKATRMCQNPESISQQRRRERRQFENRKIERENQIILKRILDAKPHYCSESLDKEYEKTKCHRNNISKSCDRLPLTRTKSNPSPQQNADQCDQKQASLSKKVNTGHLYVSQKELNQPQIPLTSDIKINRAQSQCSPVFTDLTAIIDLDHPKVSNSSHKKIVERNFFSLKKDLVGNPKKPAKEILFYWKGR